MNSEQTAKLLLADGTLLEGKAFGYKGSVVGEVVFNTGITGYQEIITDPSYYGQLVVFTYPEIGNTGVNQDDNESENISVKGVIVRQYAESPSSWRSTSSLEEWFVKQKIVGIHGVDTRSLVRHLRKFGSMNGIITNEEKLSIIQLQERLNNSNKMEGMNLVDKVSTKKDFLWNKLSPVEFDQRIKITKTININSEKHYRYIILVATI